MGDTKTIEVSESVFKRLKNNKGNNTWDEHLGKMADATYDDVVYLDPTSITDFVDDKNQYTWEFSASEEGNVKLSVQSKAGDSGVDAALAGLSPSEKVIVEIKEGTPTAD